MLVGQIQEDMEHPNVRLRLGLETVTYPQQKLEAVLHKTLGEPIFQEQTKKITIVATEFKPVEADRLR